MFQKCVGLLEEGNASHALVRVFVHLGLAYTAIEAWDDAIAYLEKGLSIADPIEDVRLGNRLKALAKQSLGNTYLEKYESLPERNDKLIREASFWSDAAFDLRKSKGGVDRAYILTWRRSIIFSVTQKSSAFCSKDTWTGPCNLGHHIVNRAVKLVRRMQSWRNVG